MTVLVPLDPTAKPQNSPSFLLHATNHAHQLSRAIHAIMKAKRIVVICGAGISVQAGIPDFRSSDGLFKSLKRENPRDVASSGKELFDASVFNAEHTTSLFCQMIAQLSDMSQAAQPTSFHHLLRSFDDRGKLLRVYTQNIDAIEQKCGLSFGVPEFETKRSKTRSKGKSKAAEEISVTDDNPPLPSTSRPSSPPAETPRCIPLHGTLQLMHCQVCNHSFPLQEYMPALVSGQPPQCPECTSLENTRQLIGKRPRGVGKLRPSVVLYNETHKDGEGVGNVVQKDLIGSSKGKGRSGADLLLVVGTSLRVPGTKRMVREFAKAVRARGSTKDEPSGLATPAASPRRSPTADEDPLPKAIYLNLDFPVPTREWEGVFDTWIQGDAQQFAEMLQVEIDKQARAKEIAVEKKKRKEEDGHELPDIARIKERGKSAKGKAADHEISPKRRKMVAPPSPPVTPPSGANCDEEREIRGFRPMLRMGSLLKPHVVVTPYVMLDRKDNPGRHRSTTPSPPESTSPKNATKRHAPASVGGRRQHSDAMDVDSPPKVYLPTIIKPLSLRDKRGCLNTQPLESFERTFRDDENL